MHLDELLIARLHRVIRDQCLVESHIAPQFLKGDRIGFEGVAVLSQLASIQNRGAYPSSYVNVGMLSV